MTDKADFRSGRHYIHLAYVPYLPEPEQRDVVLLAVAGVWAMVRRPGAMPYVCPVKDLRPRAAP